MEPVIGLTGLLRAWRAGDQEAGRSLIARVYQDLRRLAAHSLRGERAGHTLQPTALVHELYLRLFASQNVDWQDRAHFLAVAARQLRHIVIDHARRRHALKRGGTQVALELEDLAQLAAPVEARVLELDQLLDQLQELDARTAQVVELRFYGGLTEREIAEVIGFSVPTVKRDWDFARAWLLARLGP